MSSTSVGGSLYAAGIQRFVVTPNEQAAETPYMTHNIAATRQAFNLDGRSDAQFFRRCGADARADIDRNSDTIKNVRLWDHQPLLETFGQIQELRTYYDFASVDNDRYMINGELRQVMLSARELNSESLPNRTWINEHLTFTHGYGIDAWTGERGHSGRAADSVREGHPARSRRSRATSTINEPSIYFGELTNDYVLVNTEREGISLFEGRRGRERRDRVYTAPTACVSAGSADEAALQPRLPVAADSVQQRHHRRQPRPVPPEHHAIASPPSRRFCGTTTIPYLVVSTTAGCSGFATHTPRRRSIRIPTPAAGGINYIRNSVKVITDAYNGTTEFYVSDPRDPLAQTLAKIYPGLLKPLDVDAAPTCGSISATRRRSSRFRRRCSRRIT